MAHRSNELNGARTFSSSSGGLFNGYFQDKKTWDFQKHQLIDARGRRAFDMVASACAAGVYPYQLPLESRSGPWVIAEGREMLMLSSYDYLGLIGDIRIEDAVIASVRKYGTSTGGARMLTGTIDQHHQMEKEVAAFKGTAEAITFTSGYLANMAVLSALFSPQDRIVMDALSHRSLGDACRLTGVQVQRFKHNDMDSLRQELQTGPAANRTLIVADGVYSMDGDICNLPDLIALKNEFGCFLMVDDSHATGVLGAHGRGSDEHFGVDTGEVDIWTGSFAKAIPSNGGFVAVPQELAIFLQHAAAPFIFSAALCPTAVAAVRAAVAIIEAEPERVQCLKRNADFLRDGLRALGYDTGLSETAIIPVVLHEEPATAFMARRLRELDVIATPVMFPAVPQGSARLRLCVTAAHSRQDLDFALEAFRKARP